MPTNAIVLPQKSVGEKAQGTIAQACIRNRHPTSLPRGRLESAIRYPLRKTAGELTPTPSSCPCRIARREGACMIFFAPTE